MWGWSRKVLVYTSLRVALCQAWRRALRQCDCRIRLDGDVCLVLV